MCVWVYVTYACFDEKTGHGEVGLVRHRTCKDFNRTLQPCGVPIIPPIPCVKLWYACYYCRKRNGQLGMLPLARVLHETVSTPEPTHLDEAETELVKPRYEWKKTKPGRGSFSDYAPWFGDKAGEQTTSTEKKVERDTKGR